MKNTALLLVLLICFSCKKEAPKLNQAVVQDYALLFSKAENDSLTKKIIDYEEVTTNQICVYTIDSLEKNTKVLYKATRLAEQLGIGTKETDNGLLILISKFDKKIAIATGYGTEKTITDSIANAIINNSILPKFKDALYFEGINTALDSIVFKWK